MKKLILNFFVISLFVLFSCKKEDNVITNNNAPDYYGIPTIKVKNYVNRLFIDLIGREPLDVEMDSLVTLLEKNNLNFETRLSIITNLQFDSTIQSNGGSFKQLFYLTIYELQKARFLEGLPDASISQARGNANSAAISDSLIGNMLGYFWEKQQAKIYDDVLTSDTALKNGSITFNEMCRRMCFNGIYDQINMNSFNYVNAVFDNLFYRFPSTNEFTASYNMVEHDQADILFSQSGSSKYDFSKIATNSKEFNGGTVIWAFRSFLSRPPNSTELFHFSTHYQLNKDLPYIIREIMKTDEYANF